MGIIPFHNPKKNIWTRRRQGRIEKFLRAHIGGIAVMALTAGLILNQSGALRSVPDNILAVFATQYKRPLITRPSGPRVLFGRASVIDGDTIRIKGERIRLHGIDAPEMNQVCLGKKNAIIPCGLRSARYLGQLLQAGRLVSCRLVNRDGYGRFVGECSLRSGQNLSELIVRNGQAVDWPKYSGGAYAHSQYLAKTEELGVWSTRFEMPWNYRAKRRG